MGGLLHSVINPAAFTSLFSLVIFNASAVVCGRMNERSAGQPETLLVLRGSSGGCLSPNKNKMGERSRMEKKQTRLWYLICSI